MPGWSNVTAGGSDTTWTGGYSLHSVQSFNWIPYEPTTDLWLGMDFVPKVSSIVPLKLDSTRPIEIWDVSSVTASGFTGEGRP